MNIHERATRLNSLKARIEELQRELLRDSGGKSWNWVHVRLNELDTLESERKRLAGRFA